MIRSKTAGVHFAPARVFAFNPSFIISSKILAGLAIFAGLFSFAVPAAQAGAFTPGNLVVVQSDGQTSAAASISLLEYQTSGGSAVNTVTIPSASPTTAPANAALTQSGSGTSEGFLNRSQDGRYLFVVGYNLAAGTAGASSSTADRVVGRIDSLGNVDTTTRAPGYSGNNIRTAVSDTGGLIYVAGPGAGLTSLIFGAQPASTNVINSGNTRFAGIFGSQLYAIGSIGTLGRVGAGLPTNTATFTALSAAIGSTSANQFFFLDRDANVAGVDLCYVADGSSGIKKYSFDGTSWTARGTNTGTFFGLVAAANGSGTDIYATTGTGASAGNTLVKINDSAAYTNTASFGTATILATAPSGKAFRGLAFSPVGPTIIGAATATAFTTTYGTVSAAQNFSISGSLLTADITATAPTGFEVSSDGTNYGATATFAQSGGSASGTLRVRLKANAAVSGSYNSQNIVLSSTGASSVNIVTASTGNAVTAKALTITANDQTVPVGSALTNLTGSTLFTPSGLANSETVGSVSLDFGGRGTVAGAFAGAIVPSAATGGTFAAGNYSITYVAGTLTVSAAAVPAISTGGETLSSLNSIYGSVSTNTTSFTLSGANMTAAITVTPPSGFEVSTDNATFASTATVGAAGTIGSTTVYVRLSGSATAGTKTGNISLTSSGATAVNVAVASSTVAAKSVTGSFTAANKSFDGSTAATVTGRSLSGVVGSDNVSLTGGTAAFDTAGAGSGKTVTLSGATLSGTAASNYALASVSTTTADITKADQTITFSPMPSLPLSALPFTPSAVASSSLAVNFTSSDPTVATATGSTVTVVGPGTCSITASQAGDDNYNSAPDVQRSFTVNPSGAVSFDGNTYSQDFESMGTGGSSSVLPTTMTELVQLSGGSTNLAGWFIYGTGWTGAANKWVGSDKGTSSTGGFRELIDSASPVGRALGSQGSSSLQGYFGVVLKNTSGSTIQRANISYDAVMNRNPSSTPNAYPLSYMVSSNQVFSGTGSGTFNNGAGTWQNGVGFTTPTSGTGSPGTNSTGTTNTQAAITPLFKIASIQQNLTNLNWSNGAYLYIRWNEIAENGSDATAGVDNFSINAVLPAPTISGISPTSINRGSGDTPVMFTGTGYGSPETTVSLSGSPLLLTNVSSNSLTAIVGSNSLASAGTLTLTLSNPTPGGGSVTTNLAVVTPVPTIASLSPASVVAGAGNTSLTVNGTGFFSDSVVRWNGTNLATSYISPTQLAATLPASILANIASASVTVATPDVGGQFKESTATVFQVTSPTVPQLTPSLASLSGFVAPVGTPSVEQSYTLQGQYLTSNVLVTAPSEFQVSKTSGSGFTGSLNLTAAEVGAGVTVYVRYNPSAVSSSHGGNISHVSVGAVTQNVVVSGNSQPTLAVNPTSVSFNPYTYYAGDHSGSYNDIPSFLVSGTRLASAVTVAAPTDYGVSSDGVTFTSSVSLTPDAAGLVAAPVYVRFQPLSAVAADKSISITAGSLSASVTVNGRALKLNDNTSFADQAGNQQTTLSWVSSGFGTKVVILARLGAAAITDVPTNVDSLTADAAYGLGSLVGSSYVVYKADQIAFQSIGSTTVTGLTNGSLYTFKCFVINGDAASSGTSVKSVTFAPLDKVITQWNFNASSLAASTGAGELKVFGFSASTTGVFSSGSQTDLIVGTGNQALSYAGTSSTTTAIANKSSGWEMRVSTVGKENIVVYWDNRSSNTGPKHLRAQYTLDVSVANPVWVDYVAQTDGLNVANQGLYEAQVGDTWYIQRKADLSTVPGVANNPNFGFRLVASYAPGESGYRRADGTSASSGINFGGNFRTDMLTVTGTAMTQTPFDSWAAGYNLTGASAAGTADPDGDGMDNNAEFAFGTSPVSGGSRATTLASATGGIKLTWLQRSGVTYTVKSLPDLATAFDSGTTMSSSATSPQPTGLPSGYTQYEATLSTSSSRGFLRVRATAP